MKTSQLARALVVTIFSTLLVTACGSEDADAPGSTARSTASRSSASAGEQEEITPGGVAVVVIDHLGRDTVREVVTFAGDDGEGDVGVMVRLRDRTAHNFAVSVYPPEAAEEYGEVGKCPPAREQKGETSRCRTLDDGTTVTTSQIAYGFSDDNHKGSMLIGSAVSAERGAAMAMYESYDESPAINATQLEELLSDTRLAWFTDPEVNEAGRAMKLKEISG